MQRSSSRSPISISSSSSPKGNYMQRLLNLTPKSPGPIYVGPMPSRQFRQSACIWGSIAMHSPPWSCIASPPAIIYLAHVPLEFYTLPPAVLAPGSTGVRAWNTYYANRGRHGRTNYYCTSTTCRTEWPRPQIATTHNTHTHSRPVRNPPVSHPHERHSSRPTGLLAPVAPPSLLGNHAAAPSPHRHFPALIIHHGPGHPGCRMGKKQNKTFFSSPFFSPALTRRTG